MMKTNRSLLVLILLSIITLGIYSLYFWYRYAQDMNTVCAQDGKHTRGVLARIVFSVLTLGLYELIWMYGVGERVSYNCHQRGLHCNTTGSGLLLWHILGAFIFIGPFVALHKMIDGLNDLSAAHNASARVNGSGQTINVNINR